MDHEEMHNAYRRAMGLEIETVKTAASGQHIPTYVAAAPKIGPSHDLIRRLAEQHTVRWDPLCDEAAYALEYITELNQINLEKFDTAYEIMRELYNSLLEIKESTDGWPWEIKGNDIDKRAEVAMYRYRTFTHE